MHLVLSSLLFSLCLHAAPSVRADPRPLVEIPLRIHLLRSSPGWSGGTTMSEQAARRMVEGASSIWSQAGLRLVVERVVEDSPPQPTTSPAALVPSGSFDRASVNVHIVHELRPNGLTLSHRGMPAIFVRDSATLRPVPGGVSEPLPRVLSHELGHALGLSHREDLLNLMASGTTGRTLSAVEIERARRTALAVPAFRKIWPRAGP